MEEQIYKEFMRALIKGKDDIRLIEMLIDGKENEAVLAELIKPGKQSK